MRDKQPQAGDEQGGIWVPPSARRPAEPTPPPASEPATDAPAIDEPAPPAAEAVDYHDKYLRVLAEMENVKRRNLQQLNLARTKTKEDVLAGLLPMLDGFDRALTAARADNTTIETLVEGLTLLSSQFHSVLGQYQVTPIPCEVGDEFDPEIHDAVLRGPATDEVPENHILTVLERGYTVEGRVLRATRVAVAAPALDVEA